METLHTILLGPYKYLLKKVMPTLNARQKKEILARMAAFNYLGFNEEVLGNVVPYSLEITPPPFCWLGLATSMGGGL